MLRRRFLHKLLKSLTLSTEQSNNLRNSTSKYLRNLIINPNSFLHNMSNSMNQPMQMEMMMPMQLPSSFLTNNTLNFFFLFFFIPLSKPMSRRTVILRPSSSNIKSKSPIISTQSHRRLPILRLHLKAQTSIQKRSLRINTSRNNLKNRSLPLSIQSSFKVRMQLEIAMSGPRTKGSSPPIIKSQTSRNRDSDDPKQRESSFKKGNILRMLVIHRLILTIIPANRSQSINNSIIHHNINFQLRSGFINTISQISMDLLMENLQLSHTMTMAIQQRLTST